ncbi:hypothetical protein ACIP6V_09600 [Streptomyces sp. NPDC088770]|uniref:hypothetical protein n=1 Tax=Streptomyces sp. NPDC088770 TaxID=3365895 RepID=UPI00380F6247
MYAVAWQSSGSVHSDSRCHSLAGAGHADMRRVLFDADIESRMCDCCRVEPAGPHDKGLADAVLDLLSLCEALIDEDEEVENREDPDYAPDFLGPNFNRDHWRTLQFYLTRTVNGLQAHPWLHHWASPSLIRAASYTERRCEEQRSLIDTATIERSAAALQRRERSTQLASIWEWWRHREDWRAPSPDDLHYGMDERLQSRIPNATGTLAVVTIGVQLPALGADWDGMRVVETLSMWEKAVIAAYKTTADWAVGTVTLTVPAVVARELCCPARGLDLTPRLSAANQ